MVVIPAPEADEITREVMEAYHKDLKEIAPSTHGQGRHEERVSVAINADSLATWALPALSALVRQGLPLEIITDDQEFSQEWLREGQVMGCVTSLSHALRGCRMQALGAMRYVVVAEPGYAAEHLPKGLTRHNFHQVPFVAFNRKDLLQQGFVEQAFDLKRLSLKQRFVPSVEGQLRAVREGWGVSVVPELRVRAHIDAGELVNPLPAFGLDVDLYWHCWNLGSEVLDELSRALQAAAQGQLKAV
jgi:LysR family transcriptional regulator (chromosome initiation inhibitor)